MENEEMHSENVNHTPDSNVVIEPKKESRVSKSSVVLFFLLGTLLGSFVVGLIACIQIRNIASNVLVTSSTSGSEKTEIRTDILGQDVISKIESIEKGINKYYLNDVDEEELKNSMYHGLVDGLGDPYSTYYTPEELQEILESTEGIYSGIGAYIGYDTDRDYCKITKCMDGSPAEEAGLQAEDIIVEVDGEDMYKVQTSEIVTHIKGPEKTTVELKIYREGESDYLNFTVERRKIETPTITYNIDDDKIAYIQIIEFDEVTVDQFKEYYAKAEEEGMKGLVLDLRDNPGGSLSAVVDIASELLPKGLVVYTEDRDGNRKEYKCDGKHEIQIPLVVLVNGNSASASEILAGSIKDYKKGTLLGTTTFGKGIVQKIFSLSDGSALKLTISHYYTPNGNDIHKVGIVPDEELEFDRDAYSENKTDNQLDRAKEIIKEKLK